MNARNQEIAVGRLIVGRSVFTGGGANYVSESQNY